MNSSNTDPKLSERYFEILKKIQSSPRYSGDQKTDLLAVSKGQSIDQIGQIYQLGQRDFGENYAQELIQKSEEAQTRGWNEIRWTMIGHLQSNKVKTLLPHLHALQSLDSVKLAREIHKHWSPLHRTYPLPVHIEINLDCEPTKSGVKPDELPDFIEQICSFESLQIRGLMAIPAPTDPSKLGSSFERLRLLAIQHLPMGSRHLSMGMSSDYSEAIRAGSNQIRIGTALFGPRPI